MTPTIFWIPGPWRGRLAIVLRPRGGDWLVDEFQGLRSAGIGVIVSLLEPPEAALMELGDEAAAAGDAGMRFLSLPIPDRGVPSSAAVAIAIAGEIEDQLKRGSNVAIHCRQSVGRAGLMAATILTASGADPSRAIEVVSAARGQAVPETTEQRNWLLQLQTRVSL
jgi:protein-tyrosine phosphatase